MSEEVEADREDGAGFRFRDTTRAPFITTARLRFDRLGGAVEAETADISMEGMFVQTEEPRPVGTLVQFEFDVGEGESIQGLGDVVWVRAHSSHNKPAGMGIQFRYVDPQSREHVHRIVSEFISQLSGSTPAPSIPTDGPEEERPSPMGTVAVPLSSLPGLDDPARPLGDLVDPSTGGGAPPPAPTAPASPASSSSTGSAEGEGAGEGLLRERAERDSDENPFGSVLNAPNQPRTTERPSSGSISGSFSAAVSSAGRSMDAPTVKAPPMLMDDPDEDESGDPARESSGVLFGDSASDQIELEGLGGELPSVEPYDGSTDLSNYDIYGRGASTERRGPMTGILLVLVVLLALLAWLFKPWELWSGDPGSDRPIDAGTAEAGEETVGERRGEVADGEVATSSEEAPAADAQPAETAPGAGEVASPRSAETVPAVSSPPSRLTALDSVDGDGQTLVRIAADEPLQPGGFSSLRLQAPPRFVLKIEGVESVLRTSSSGRLFRGVRSGIHQGPRGEEIHLVFDMRTADYEADVEVVDGQLLVTFR